MKGVGRVGWVGRVGRVGRRNKYKRLIYLTRPHKLKGMNQRRSVAGREKLKTFLKNKTTVKIMFFFYITIVTIRSIRYLTFFVTVFVCKELKPLFFIQSATNSFPLGLQPDIKLRKKYVLHAFSKL